MVATMVDSRLNEVAISQGIDFCREPTCLGNVRQVTESRTSKAARQATAATLPSWSCLLSLKTGNDVADSFCLMCVALC